MADGGRVGDERQRWRDQQTALADFGMYALRSLEIDAILQEACALVARGLDVPVAKALEVLPGGEELLIRAAVGLPPGTVGQVRIPADIGSAAGYALKTGVPVISDVATERRFRIAEIVRRVGARKTANVVIDAEAGPYGVLEIDALDDRELTRDHINFLQIHASLLGAAINRQRAGALARRLAREREVLLHELQHRIKNDLQVVKALLSMEGRRAGSPELQARLDNVATRVDTLGLLHERLLAGGQVGRVDLAGYLDALCRDRLSMQGLKPGGPVGLALDLAPVTVDHDAAVAVGLIANEFLTNSLKHAFPFGAGTVSVRLDRPGPGRARLVLADDGVGLAPSAADGGTGMRLVGLLVQQIGAEAEWSKGPGTRLSLAFSAPDLDPVEGSPGA